MSKRGQEGIPGEGSVDPKSMKFGDGETKTCEFGTAQRVEYEEKLSARIERLQQPEECPDRTGKCLDQHRETGAGHRPKSSRAFSSVETGKNSNCGVLETGKEKRIFSLNQHRETSARCGFTQKQIRNRASKHEDPNTSLLGEGLPMCAKEVGKHRTFFKIWKPTR